MARQLEIHPFTAARLERASEEARREELTKLGLAFLHHNRLLRWDASDRPFALELADREYCRNLKLIARAAHRLAATKAAA